MRKRHKASSEGPIGPSDGSSVEERSDTPGLAEAERGGLAKRLVRGVFDTPQALAVRPRERSGEDGQGSGGERRSAVLRFGPVVCLLGATVFQVVGEYPLWGHLALDVMGWGPWLATRQPFIRARVLRSRVTWLFGLGYFVVLMAYREVGLGERSTNGAVAVLEHVLAGDLAKWPVDVLLIQLGFTAWIVAGFWHWGVVDEGGTRNPPGEHRLSRSFAQILLASCLAVATYQLQAIGLLTLGAVAASEPPLLVLVTDVLAVLAAWVAVTPTVRPAGTVRPEDGSEGEIPGPIAEPGALSLVAADDPAQAEAGALSLAEAGGLVVVEDDGEPAAEAPQGSGWRQRFPAFETRRVTLWCAVLLVPACALQLAGTWSPLGHVGLDVLGVAMLVTLQRAGAATRLFGSPAFWLAAAGYQVTLAAYWFEVLSAAGRVPSFEFVGEGEDRKVETVSNVPWELNAFGVTFVVCCALAFVALYVQAPEVRARRQSLWGELWRRKGTLVIVSLLLALVFKGVLHTLWILAEHAHGHMPFVIVSTELMVLFAAHRALGPPLPDEEEDDAMPAGRASWTETTLDQRPGAPPRKPARPAPRKPRKPKRKRS